MRTALTARHRKTTAPIGTMARRSALAILALALLAGCTGEISTETHAALHEAFRRAQALLERYGYGAVFVVIFLEGVGIPAPGEMLVWAAAAEAGRGDLNAVLLFAVITLAAVAGNSAGYAIGRFGGRRLLLRLPLSEDRIGRATELFDRYGGWFILVARFIDGPRQFNGIIAGLLNMPWWQFSFWNLLGALLWVLVWGGSAYWLGRDFDKVLPVLQRFEPYLLGLLAAVLIAGAVAVWRRRTQLGR